MFWHITFYCGGMIRICGCLHWISCEWFDVKWWYFSNYLLLLFQFFIFDWICCLFITIFTRLHFSSWRDSSVTVSIGENPGNLKFRRISMKSLQGLLFSMGYMKVILRWISHYRQNDSVTSSKRLIILDTQ